MDNLTKINYDLLYVPSDNENTLANDIFKKILDAYVIKCAKNQKIENSDNFENHIVNPQTVRGAFGTSEKFGYKGVSRNLQTFKSVLKGIESAHSLSTMNTEPSRSII